MPTPHARAWILSLGLAIAAPGLTAPGLTAAQAPPGQPPADADDEAADTARYEALLQEGVRLRRRGADVEALERFESAFALRPTPKARAQIALAEAALGRWVVAERHLLEALEATDDPWIADNRGSLGQTLRTIQDRLGSIEVLGGVPEAEVRINGRVVGTLPLDEPIRAVAGEVTLEVLHPGHYAVRRQVVVPTGGRVTRETIALSPLPEEPDETEACPAGQLPTNDHCCWPGQRWTAGACAGEPRCPEGLTAENQDCVTPRRGGAGGDAVVTGAAAGAAGAAAGATAGAGAAGVSAGGTGTGAGVGTTAANGAATGSGAAGGGDAPTAAASGGEASPREPEPEPPKQTGFVLTLRGVFAGFLQEDGGALGRVDGAGGVSPGFGAEVLLGARVSPFFSFGLFGTWHMVDATEIRDDGVDVDAAWSLSPGLYMRLHSGRGFAGGFLDLWGGVGIAPYSLYRIEFANGDRLQTTAITMPIHFGVSVFVSKQVALDLGGSFTGWFPSEECVQIDGLTSGEECRSEGSESFWGWNFGVGFSFLL